MSKEKTKSDAWKITSFEFKDDADDESRQLFALGNLQLLENKSFLWTKRLRLMHLSLYRKL